MSACATAHSGAGALWKLSTIGLILQHSPGHCTLGPACRETPRLFGCGAAALRVRTLPATPYSYLSTLTGSNPAALRAGMYPASSATAANNAVASAIAAGSFAFTP
jgi:hypothetical protein